MGMKEVIRTIACGICKAMGGAELTPTPIPEPVLHHAATISIDQMSSILLDKLEEMGQIQAELYLPDNECKVYKKAVVQAFLGLDEISCITYIPELHDCDDFAAELFGKGIPLVWTNLHALNFFVDENLTLWFIEPQTDQIAQNLAGWEGNSIRFFLGR